MPKQVISTLVLRVAGMPESDLDQLISPVYKKYENPATTILAAAGDIQVHLRARCATEAEATALLAEVGGPIELLLGDRIYSRNGDSLEEVVGELLRKQHATLAVAESGTAGCWRSASPRSPAAPIISWAASSLTRSDEDGDAGRAGGDARGARRGEQGDRGSHGARGAAAHRRDLCALHHGRGGAGERRRNGAGRDGVHRPGRRRPAAR